MKGFRFACLTIALLSACGNADPKGSDKTIVINNGSTNSGADMGGGSSDGGMTGSDAEIEVPETCGDGVLQAPEACDGTELTATCDALGRGGGDLLCTATCQHDVSQCEVATACSAGPSCDGDLVRTCDANGVVSTTDCAATGASCVAGACLSPCEAAAARGGSAGCEFVGAQLPNSQGGPDTEFVVVNGGTQTASVTFASNAEGTQTLSVTPGGASVFEVSTDFDVVAITSDQPVSVSQFNAPGHNASQDSSLLFPTHAWGTSTHVVTWGGWEGSLWAGVSTSDTAFTSSGQTLSAGLSELAYADFASDPSGTLVETPQPSLIFGGHTCTSVITSYCDHLQHALFDDSRLGGEYHLGQVAFDDYNSPIAVQIVAVEPATAVQLSGSSTETATLSAGEAWTLEFEEGIESLSVSSDKPVAVVKLIGPARAPSMVALPHRGLWARRYTIAGSQHVDGAVQLLAPESAEVTVNGAIVSGWVSQGEGIKRATTPLLAGEVVTVTATEGVQALVIGKLAYASFMHLGGFGPE